MIDFINRAMSGGCGEAAFSAAHEILLCPRESTGDAPVTSTTELSSRSTYCSAERVVQLAHESGMGARTSNGRPAPLLVGRCAAGVGAPARGGRAMSALPDAFPMLFLGISCRTMSTPGSRRLKRRGKF